MGERQWEFSLAEGERFGHRFSAAGETVDPGSTPSRLRHSNLYQDSLNVCGVFQTATVVLTGGGGEIRTLDSLARIAVFKTAALDRYATPPHGNYTLKLSKLSEKLIPK